MPSQVTVTAVLNDPSGGALQGNAFVRFKLRNFQGFVPRVSGTAIVCETQIDSLPDGSGNISQALWGNNNITPSTTFYTVEFWNQGRITSSGNYTFDADTNLNTAAQLNSPPVPPGFLLVLENNGTLNSSQSTLNLESSDGSVTITDEGAGTLNLQTASGGDTYSISFVAAGIPKNSATTNDGANFGMSCTFIEASLTNAPTGYSASATEPSFVRVQSSSLSASGGFTDGQTNITTGVLSSWTEKLRIVGQTDSRYWWGLSDQLGSAVESVFNSDTPAANFIGFRWSSSTDTNVQAVCQTDSSHQTLVDTGVAPNSTTPQSFGITVSGSSIVFTINGTTVATISTNVPSNSTGLATLTVCDGYDNASTNYNFDFFYVLAKISL